MSYAKEIAGTILYQLETTDPLFIGTLGIKPKHYAEENKNVKLTFDASLVIIGGKKYKKYAWIVVEYNYNSDTYNVSAQAMKSKFGELVQHTLHDVYADMLWKVIHKMVTY